MTFATKAGLRENQLASPTTGGPDESGLSRTDAPSTTARTTSSSARASTASPGAASIASDSALKACGRFSVSVTTPRSSRCLQQRFFHRVDLARGGRRVRAGQQGGGGRGAGRRGRGAVASIVAKPGVAVAMGKALFYRQIEVGIESAYEDAGATMACNMMDRSALEGVQAFIEKRPSGRLAAQASTTLGRGAPTFA